MTTPTENVIALIKSIVGEAGAPAQADWAPYLCEWRGNWRGAPSMVVAPASTEEVAAVVKICAQHKIAITPQGGNTGLVGGQMPTNGEILLITKRLRKVRNIAPLDNTITVEAGLTLAETQEHASKVDRLFPLSIGSEGSCQIGGVISTNAGGVNVVRYGNMRELVLGLEVVLPSGETWHGLKRLRKDNTGYDLKQLFVGGEGTLGVITAATLRLFPQPAETATALVAVASPVAALRLFAKAQASSGGVTSFELLSRQIVDLLIANIPGVRDPFAKKHPWYVLTEISSGLAGAARQMLETSLAAAIEAGDADDAIVAANIEQANALWRMRHAASEAMKPEGAQAKFDVSVPVGSIPDFLEHAEQNVLAACAGARIAAFGHMGDGNIHYDVLQPSGNTKDFEENAAAIKDAVYSSIDRYGGSISAEHGVGIARRDDIATRKQPAELAMMRAIKKALDPDGVMNPGKMI